MSFEELEKYLKDTDADSHCSIEEAVYLHLQQELQTKDEEIGEKTQALTYANSCIGLLNEEIETKDTLIKELIECLEFYSFDKVPDRYDVGGKARTFLNSEAVKAWRGKR